MKKSLFYITLITLILIFIKYTLTLDNPSPIIVYLSFTIYFTIIMPLIVSLIIYCIYNLRKKKVSLYQFADSTLAISSFILCSLTAILLHSNRDNIALMLFTFTIYTLTNAFYLPDNKLNQRLTKLIHISRFSSHIVVLFACSFIIYNSVNTGCSCG